jgi:hypothetical protein
MKYLMAYEQVDYGTKFGKVQSQKEAQKRNASNADFKTKFFEEFPKGTALSFKDKESEYQIVLDDVKFTDSGFYLIFKAENGQIIKLEKPFNLKFEDAEKISLLPIEILPESKELIEKMLNK